MSREAAVRLLGAFGATIGIPDLRLDEAGCCALAFDEVVVNLEADPDGRQLFLYASVGPVPSSDSSELYKQLLDGNLFWKDTGGATLGLDREGARVVLLQSLPAERISDPEFAAAVEQFVNAAEAWTRRIAEAAAEPPPAGDAEAPFVILPSMLA